VSTVEQPDASAATLATIAIENGRAGAELAGTSAV